MAKCTVNKKIADARRNVYISRAIRVNGGKIGSNVSAKERETAFKAAFGVKPPPVSKFSPCDINIPYPGGKGKYVTKAPTNKY